MRSWADIAQTPDIPKSISCAASGGADWLHCAPPYHIQYLTPSINWLTLSPSRDPAGAMAPLAPDVEARIAAVRRFSRFYTRQLGLLQESLVHTRFSLTEARMLYELAHRQTVTASGLATDP